MGSLSDMIAQSLSGPRLSDLAPTRKPNNGLVVPGNIDLTNRPIVKNEDGSISTVRSMGFNDGEHEVLIPTVHPDGYIMSNDDAVKHYFKTGQHLGKFLTPEASEAYAIKLHDDQADMYVGKK